MSFLTRVALLSAFLLVCLPALAGAGAPRPAAGGPLVDVMVTLDAPPIGRAPDGAEALHALQSAVAERIRDELPGAQIQRRYSLVLDGFAITLPQRELSRLESLDGVARVYPTSTYQSTRTSSPGFIGATALWGAGLKTAGNGIKIGIIDDGINQAHRYFSPKGFRMPKGFPKGIKSYTTRKVIVARAFAPKWPRSKYARRPFDPKWSEHATHVAGIAAGDYRTLARGRRISGVAPKAYLGNYKVLTVPSGFGLNGNSPEIVAGIEAAVRDGMDVINLSIGEAEIDPRSDIVAAALDGAAAAGVVPVVAAGNSFSELGAGSVSSPGSSARAITAAAENEEGPVIASFSSAGPAPVSQRMKPDVTAPGVGVLSSVPRRIGTWANFSGTSMAAPHVAGGAALLLQRHPGWTVEQVKSALVQTGDRVFIGGQTEALSTRAGGGTINLVRANAPLIFASPTSVGFGFVAPGGSVGSTIGLADAGGGAGDWAVTVNAQQPAEGAAVATLPAVTVPGSLVLTASAAPGAAQAEHTGYVVLTRGSDSRRIPYWFRVAAPALGAAQWMQLGGTGTYHGDTRGHPALVDTYRYPDDPRELGVARTLLGPEQVFRVSLVKPVANFGVAVTGGSPEIVPRVVRAGDENQLVGEAGLPYNLNPYLSRYGTPVRIAGAALPGPGDYDIVFDSPRASDAGAFTFRYWVADAKPPSLHLVSTRGGLIRVFARDGGAGVDPSRIRLLVDGHGRAKRYEAGRNLIVASTRGLRRGRHVLTVRVSDRQESKNMENVPRILPNTARLRAAFVLR